VLTGWAAKYFSPKRITITSAIATGIFMLIIIIPNRENALWITLFLTGLALALCLPACSALLSMTASESEQGSAMGNNQAMSAGAEAISGLVGGLLAAWFIKFPLIVMGILAIIAGIILLFVKPKSSLDRRSRRYN
jgi:MFS family permease